MNLMNLEPFLKASAYVFEQFQMSCQELNSEQEYEAESSEDILTMVGITGDIRGQIIFRIPMQVGLEISSVMMGVPTIKSLDQMAQSALLELGNMICGNAMTIFTEKGLSMNITPPTLVVGKSIEVSGTEVNTLYTTLSVNNMDSIELRVLYEE
ncbi:chemotaxis protein CheX [Siminovitchia sp. 179-K 8D1 HS]|uniref:chemotaxis protein CheX n=1 Tax=Siminovitchia sp. 179-K 8D1 HS TaxID=3142385 RepID=UPI0039A3E18C